jgi:hypothetical protein
LGFTDGELETAGATGGADDSGGAPSVGLELELEAAAPCSGLVVEGLHEGTNVKVPISESADEVPRASRGQE